MIYVDTFDKIVQSYFAALTTRTFEYKGKNYNPHPLRISAGLFQGFTCPEGCGGCCHRFSLDYLPGDRLPQMGAGFERRIVHFNGSEFYLYSDLQLDNESNMCKHLRREDGRCGIHGRHPFSCDFELIRFSISKTDRPNQLTTRLFGRGWSYSRTDGGKGAKCEILPTTDSSWLDAIRKLERLQKWTDYFHLPTVLPKVLDWARTYPTEPLFLNREFSGEQERKISFFT